MQLALSVGLATAKLVVGVAAAIFAVVFSCAVGFIARERRNRSRRRYPQ